MTSCWWHRSVLLSFSSFPTFFKKQWAFCQCTSHIFTHNPSRHPKRTLTNEQYNVCTHKYANTNSPLGGCPKVSGQEGRTQKLRKQLGVRKVLGPVSVTFVELLLHQLFYSPQKQLSIWFLLFLCWQCWQSAAIFLSRDGQVVESGWFILTHWALVTVLRPDRYSKKQLSSVHVIWSYWDSYGGISLNQVKKMIYYYSFYSFLACKTQWEPTLSDWVAVWSDFNCVRCVCQAGLTLPRFNLFTSALCVWETQTLKKVVQCEKRRPEYLQSSLHNMTL